MKQIVLAGGCFWGVEKYFSLLKGVVRTETAYVNGDTANPSYEDVCRKGTNHAEAILVEYDPAVISLDTILEHFYSIIDPVSVNKQGNDRGVQFRTGIYYENEEDRETAQKSLDNLQKKYSQTLAIELKPLANYYPAEEYHQKYLDKNPNGYCHIGAAAFDRARNSQ